MKSRKHRIVVEVTFDRPVNARLARRSLDEVLNDADKRKSLGLYPADIIKTQTKEFDRVVRGERLRDTKAASTFFDRQMGYLSAG